ncbi:hypothetical protein KCP69_18690 [Salmonella enterica subsp. enterica]|nr:hypothetical protein KCP69_18690 [Salmonella enterica subsp. enterica]
MSRVHHELCQSAIREQNDDNALSLRPVGNFFTISNTGDRTVKRHSFFLRGATRCFGNYQM